MGPGHMPYGGPPQYQPGMGPSRHHGPMAMAPGPMTAKGSMGGGSMGPMGMYRRHAPYPSPHHGHVMAKRQMSYPPNGTQMEVSDLAGRICKIVCVRSSLCSLVLWVLQFPSFLHWLMISLSANKIKLK